MVDLSEMFGDNRDIIVSITFAICCILWIPLCLASSANELLAKQPAAFTAGIFIMLLGCLLNLLVFKFCNRKAMLYLFSVIAILIGSIIYFIGSINYTNQGCMTYYNVNDDADEYVQCWWANFGSYLAVFLIAVYLSTLIYLFKFKGKLGIFKSKIFGLVLLILTAILNIIWFILFLNLFADLYPLILKIYLCVNIILNSITIVISLIIACGKIQIKYKLLISWYILCSTVSLFGCIAYFSRGVTDVILISWIGRIVLVSIQNVWIIMEAFNATTMTQEYEYIPVDPL